MISQNLVRRQNLDIWTGSDGRRFVIASSGRWLWISSKRAGRSRRIRGRPPPRGGVASGSTVFKHCIAQTKACLANIALQKATKKTDCASWGARMFVGKQTPPVCAPPSLRESTLCARNYPPRALRIFGRKWPTAGRNISRKVLVFAPGFASCNR